jgi:hypothetical protein
LGRGDCKNTKGHRAFNQKKTEKGKKREKGGKNQQKQKPEPLAKAKLSPPGVPAQ